jgi:ribonucleoside-diphosphate reductase alpha chain
MLPNEKSWINNLLKQRYYQPDESTWPQICQRVAGLGKTPEDKAAFFNYLLHCDFLPNSPTLFNAGTGKGNLSACYVLPMKDSLEEIFDTAKNTALIHKFGGGTGFDFSRLRPENSAVGGTNQVASGPLSFMRVIDANTQEIKQGGKRRGANMAELRIDHPDIIKFIKMKTSNDGTLTNFNISVSVTDEFMEKLQKYPDDNFVAKWNDNFFLITLDHDEVIPVRPSTVIEQSEKINHYTYRQIWDLIAQSAWTCADPGIVFIDRINEQMPASYLAHPEYLEESGDDLTIRATNPCGEQPLPDYGSCNLVALNLGNFVHNQKMDWDRLQDAIKYAYRLGEAVINENVYPIPEIEEHSRAYRNIGVGVMGYADACILLGMKYGEEDALAFGEEVMKFIYKWTFVESVEYAEQFGSFKGWEYGDYKPLIDGRQLPPDTRKKYKQTGLRNICITTIAPTGSIGYIADCSTGIEPHFADKVFRIDQSNPDGTWITTPLAAQYPEVFVAATELDIDAHVAVQAVFQKWVDSGISKTINMDSKVTVDDVKRAYMLAWESNCKGVTIYRDGSKSIQVLNTSENKNKPKDLDDISEAVRFRLPAEGLEDEFIYITVSHANHQPVEMFVNYPYLNRPSLEHTQRREQLDSISRLISVALRYHIPLDKLIEQLEKSKGSMKGTVAQISNVLKEFASRGDDPYTENCLSCDEGNMVFQSGCATCDECGYSECG